MVAITRTTLIGERGEIADTFRGDCGERMGIVVGQRRVLAVGVQNGDLFLSVTTGIAVNGGLGEIS